jgi:hypothetical protein
MESLKITVSSGEIVFTEPCPYGKKVNVGSAPCACCKYCDHTDYESSVVFCTAGEEEEDWL